eukprot:IDg9654t1
MYCLCAGGGESSVRSMTGTGAFVGAVARSRTCNCDVPGRSASTLLPAANRMPSVIVGAEVRRGTLRTGRDRWVCPRPARGGLRAGRGVERERGCRPGTRGAHAHALAKCIGGVRRPAVSGGYGHLTGLPDPAHYDFIRVLLVSRQAKAQNSLCFSIGGNQNQLYLNANKLD